VEFLPAVGPGGQRPRATRIAYIAYNER